MTVPPQSQVPKSSPWRQLAIVFVSSLFLAIACGGSGLWLSNSLSKTLSIVSNILLITAIGSFAIFVLTILFAFIQLFIDLTGRSRR
jgi:hypothetical protein